MSDQAMTEAYRNADNGGQHLIAVSFGLVALTTLFFAFFLISRYYRETAIGPLMFWLIVFAYIFNIGNAVDNALSAMLGDAGKHVDTLDPDTNIASGKIGKAADYLYIPAVFLPKLAVLSLYMQVFPGKIYRYMIYGNAGLLICTLLAGLLQTTFICKPFSAYWTGDGKCGDLMTTYRWLSYPNIFTCFYMLVMPFPALLKLQVDSATKIKLMITFLTGSLGIIAAILRMVSFYTIPIFTDPTWYLIQPSIYSVLEPSAYIICAIMPTLRHLTRRVARSAGIPKSLNLASYGASATRPSRGVSGRVREKFGGITLKNNSKRESATLDRDIEMQRGSGWNKIEAVPVGLSRKESFKGGIVCKTDIHTVIEAAYPGEPEPWMKKGEGKAEEGSSIDEKDFLGRGEGFGDEVPLRQGKSGAGGGVAV